MKIPIVPLRLFLCYLLTLSLLSITSCKQKETLEQKQETGIPHFDELCLTVKQNPDSIFTIIQKQLELFEDTTQPANILPRAQIYFLMAQAKRYSKQLALATPIYLQSISLFEQCADSAGLARACHETGTIYYFTNNYRKAIAYYQRAANIRKSLSNNQDYAKSISNVGLGYFRLAVYDSSTNAFQEAYQIREKLQDTAGLINTLNNIGMVYLLKSDYAKAQEIYLRALNITDTSLQTTTLASLYNNLGYIHNELGTLDSALNYFYKSSIIYQQHKANLYMAKTYINIAEVNMKIAAYDIAKDYAEKAREEAIFAENKQLIADANLLIANIFVKHEQWSEAQTNYLNALKINEEIGNKWQRADCHQNLGEISYLQEDKEQALQQYLQALKLYEEADHTMSILHLKLKIADIYLGKNQLNKALKLCRESLEQAQELHNPYAIKNAHMKLAEIYQKKNLLQKAFAHSQIALQTSDTIVAHQKADVILEMEKKYQTERMLQEIERQKWQLARNKIEIANAQLETQLQHQIRNIALAASILLCALTIGLFRSLISKKRMNEQLSLQKKTLQTKNNALRRLNDELNDQRNQIEMQNVELTSQRDWISAINENLKRGVKYAFHIQQAILPSKERLVQVMGTHCLYYRPKEMVGGDFYWVQKQKEHRVIVVGDCTGHGISGGFLTMLALSHLKNIILHRNTFDPAEILSELRKEIIESLEQRGNLMEQADGVDMAIISLNDKTGQMQFSGGRGNAILVQNGQSQLLKGDRIGVSFTPIMKEFTNVTLNINGDETVYLYTDGYTDQFNRNRKKFGRRQLIELCEASAREPLSMQRDIFHRTFELWKGNTEQIDDALVLGFRTKLYN